jgi:hypothetical protein
VLAGVTAGLDVEEVGSGRLDDGWWCGWMASSQPRARLEGWSRREGGCRRAEGGRGRGG